MKNLKVTKMNSSVPTLEDSDYHETNANLLEINSAEYFCTQGHSFSIGFNDHVNPPFAFECPDCKTVAFTIPADENPLLKTPYVRNVSHDKTLVGV